MHSNVKSLVAATGMGSLKMSAESLGGALGIRSLEGSGAALDRYALPSTLEGALGYLNFFNSIFTLLRLFEAYFPKEFACSTKAIVPGVDEAYSEREYEFFGLIDDHLFPIPWFLQDAMERETREYSLPIVCMGREWWNDDVGEWELGWHLLLWLTGDGEVANDALTQRCPEVAPLLKRRIKQGKLALVALEKYCSGRDGPLAFLPQALRILLHDTGCWFLDIYSEDASAYVEWTREDLDQMADHWRRATLISERADQFIEWIDADPVTHFKEVIRIWNRYIREEQDNHILLINRPQPTAR